MKTAVMIWATFNTQETLACSHQNVLIHVKNIEVPRWLWVAPSGTPCRRPWTCRWISLAWACSPEHLWDSWVGWWWSCSRLIWTWTSWLSGGDTITTSHQVSNTHGYTLITWLRSYLMKFYSYLFWRKCGGRRAAGNQSEASLWDVCKDSRSFFHLQNFTII